MLTLIECRVNVTRAVMSCAPPATPGTPLGFNANVIMGGQDVYVKVSGSNATYDSGTQIFQAGFTLQNLTMQLLGTTDGTTVSGVSVFFHSGPTVTGGSGNVEVANEDGTGTFTSAGQPYFLYNQILSPYEISTSKTWQFNVDNTVTSFSWTLYVSAPMVDDGAPLLDAVWQGDVSADWQTAGNWLDDAVPGATSVVSVPSGVGTMPVLSADAQAAHVRVSTGSTLDLATFTLEALGNVDAVGTISNGTVELSGAEALLKGNVPALQVTGSTSLQGSTKATGAVNVTGSLTIKDQALNISVP
ncbi:MAG TPA: hypothetical protein VFX98_02365 [Longimicrobiaceae bacterium]|nr:hypothetical protein [Longimicrobiaceae bacterium]